MSFADTYGIAVYLADSSDERLKKTGRELHKPVGRREFLIFLYHFLDYSF